MQLIAVERPKSRDGQATTQRVVVDVAVEAGGRIEQITVENEHGPVELLVNPSGERIASSTGWGSFPMAPWAGRLRHGRFRWDERMIQLALNHVDEDRPGGGGPITPPVTPSHGLSADDRRHAIHGTTFSQPWTVTSQGPTRCEMACPIDGALGWPFAGTARQTIDLHPDHVTLELSVDTERESFPASIGWHPWFVKPDRLVFEPSGQYELDDIGLPTGRVVDVSPPPWDDCFVDVTRVELVYDRSTAPVIGITSDCDHWVVFDHPDRATCVEPQSGPPDAPNLRPALVTVDSPLRRTMTIAW